MNYVLICGLILVATEINAQFRSEKVYYMGRHFSDKECRVQTYPNWGMLTFLDEESFVCLNFIEGINQRDSSLLMRKYKVKGNVLILESIRSALPKIYGDSLIESERIRLKKLKFPDVKFKISQCNSSDTILTEMQNKIPWYGSPAKEHSHGHVRQFKEFGWWDKLLN